MKTDTDLERLLQDALRQELDDQYGPDPAWDASPAALRIAHENRLRPRRRVVRLLGIAALVAIGVGSALVVGAPDEPPVATSSNGWIAYGMQPEDGGDHDIWFVGVESEPRRAVGSDTDTVDQICPAFAPDGRTLAYGEVDRSGAAPATAVVVAGVDGDGAVTEQFRVDVGATPPCPVWSPTGDRMAFGVPLTSVTNPEGGAEGSEVWILTVADRSITVLPDLLATDLEFSPDGSRLAVASGRDAVGGGNHLRDGRLHLYDLRAGTTRTLEGTEGALSLTWSPDGERIAYQRIPEGTGDSFGQLSVIDLATEQQRALSAGRYASFGALHGIGPVWSPDGESIVYQRCRPVQCSGEDHDVVRVWPNDLSTDGTPREEIVPISEHLADGTERPLKGPYWVSWSPDGEYLLFAAWSLDVDPLLGVVPAAPGSTATILVTAQDVTVNPVYDYGPFVPIQSWGRLPSDAALPTATPAPSGTQPTAQPSTAEATASAAARTGLPAGPVTLTTATDEAVSVTITIAAPDWGGEPDDGWLCRIDSSATCAARPDDARLMAFAAPEYEVYGEACQWSTTRPENPATSVDEFIEALAVQGSRDESAPEDITVGGYDGQRIVLRMHFMDFETCDDGHPSLFGPPGGDPLRSSDGLDQVEEVWAVDVNGTIVVLVGTYYPETPPDTIEELRAILASATFD